MKLDDDTRFPHPVLSSNTGDFLNGNFSLDIEVNEAPFPTHVSFICRPCLTEPTILKAIHESVAYVAIFVTCLETYFNKLIPLGIGETPVAFDVGALSGSVKIRPLILARSMISKFSLVNCHAEFGGGCIDLPVGSILAIDQEKTINVGREKLAQIETIFSIVEAGDLVDNEISVNLESEKIQILVSSNVYQNFNLLRQSEYGRAIILNSVYLPAVMEVLNSIGDGCMSYEGKRWYKIFVAKCEFLAIDFDSKELWKNAQLILDMPFKAISGNKKIMGE